LCREGYYSTGGTTGCLFCEYGTFTDLNGTSACAECAHGSFSPQGSTKVCIFIFQHKVFRHIIDMALFFTVRTVLAWNIRHRPLVRSMGLSCMRGRQVLHRIRRNRPGHMRLLQCWQILHLFARRRCKCYPHVLCFSATHSIPSYS
jgi:hypothetical protein